MPILAWGLYICPKALHHAVTQLLFASSRACEDIHIVVALMTTIVRSPAEDDWGTVNRVLHYMRSAIYMPLILRADGFNIVKWWVDASFATHKDCWGHTGVTMSLR
jgi:hypothetical protein